MLPPVVKKARAGQEGRCIGNGSVLSIDEQEFRGSGTVFGPRDELSLPNQMADPFPMPLDYAQAARHVLPDISTASGGVFPSAPRAHHATYSKGYLIVKER